MNIKLKRMMNQTDEDEYDSSNISLSKTKSIYMDDFGLECRDFNSSVICFLSLVFFVF